jgi:hypothetical protein
MCDCSDFEKPDVFQQATRRARKHHRCGECRGLIQAGGAYWETRGLWDGQWSTHKTCGACFVVAHSLLECFAFGELQECLNEEHNLRHRNDPARIALAGMKRRCRRAERALPALQRHT